MNMGNVIEYKGYYSKVEYSKEDNVLYGKIEGINDLVTFECDNVSAVHDEFQAAVDDYLEYCEKIGKKPNKVYKGSFNVRIEPELHKDIAMMAFRESKSLNEIVEEAIEEFVHPKKYLNISKLEVTDVMNEEKNNSFCYSDSNNNDYTLRVATINS